MMNSGKPRGKPFEKGNPGGPGRPKSPEVERKLARLTRTRFNSIVRQYLNMTVGELQETMKHPDTPSLDIMVISVMNKAIKQGDHNRMNWFLEQLFGKLKEHIRIENDGSKFNIDELSKEELEKVRDLMDRCKTQ